MTAATLLALTLFLLPLQLSPGPANLYFAALTGRFGLKEAIPALVGYLTAAFSLTLLIGLGLNTAVFARPEIMCSMQLLGAAYMLWLAWSFLRSSEAVKESSVPERTGLSFNLLSGALVLLLNPKAYFIVALTLAQFARGAQTPMHVVLVALVILATYILAFAIWTGASAQLSERLGGKRLSLIYAASMALVAIGSGYEALRPLQNLSL